jgi:hypothetical protein
MGYLETPNVVSKKIPILLKTIILIVCDIGIIFYVDKK